VRTLSSSRFNLRKQKKKLLPASAFDVNARAPGEVEFASFDGEEG
jgi:hypothetical protein